jgi:biopolymer transport protein ExbD
VQKAGVAQCKLLDNGMALQSFADAMKLACGAPPSDPAYFRANLLNPEVIQLFGALGNVLPQERAARVHAAIARAQITSCPAIDAATHAQADVPKVHGAGFVSPDYPTLAVVATDHGIVIDGKAIVAVTNGAVDPAEIDGGALGIEIHRVHDFIKAAADALATRGTPTRVQLVIAPALPYRLLVQLAYSAKRAGITDFGLVVSVADALAAIPIRIPDKRPPGTTPTGLQLMVAITDDKLTLWSASGSEGTLQKPKVVTTSCDELAKALAEIRDRRWPDSKRPDADRSIFVLADSGIAVQRVADVLAVVRATADGKELFPDVVLSTGLQ